MRKTLSRGVALAVVALLAAGCGGSEDPAGGEPGAGLAAKRKDYHPAMQDPSLADEEAPATFDAIFRTTKGNFTVRFHRKWAPNGVDRVWNLLRIGYFDDVAFFRVVKDFMAQFGIHGDPQVNTYWMDATIDDDPVTQKNERGYVSFAKTNEPNSRSVQLFVNYKDNVRLDNQAFAPVGRVIGGMDVVDALNSEYGEKPSQQQGIINARGNAYLKEEYPGLDYILSAEVLEEPAGEGPGR